MQTQPARLGGGWPVVDVDRIGLYTGNAEAVLKKPCIGDNERRPGATVVRGDGVNRGDLPDATRGDKVARRTVAQLVARSTPFGST